MFECAQRENRVILTNDPDFFSLLEEGPHRGILYLTTQRAPIGRIIRDIARLVDTSRPEEFENNIFYIPRNPWAIESLLIGRQRAAGDPTEDGNAEMRTGASW